MKGTHKGGNRVSFVMGRRYSSSPPLKNESEIASEHLCVPFQSSNRVANVAYMTGKWKRTFSQPGAAAGRLAEHRGASAAHDNRLAVAKHGRDVEATLALDVHEERVRRLNKSLELVLALLELSRLVQEVNVVRENLSVRKRVRRVSTIVPQIRSNRFHPER